MLDVIVRKVENLLGRVAKLETLENPPKYSGDQNPIVNGNMSVNQRVSAVSLVTGVAAYALDQWRALNNSAGQVTTITQEVVPTNSTDFLPELAPPNFLRWNQTVAGSGGTNCQINQPIEDVRLWAGLPVTLSFWARNSVANATLAIRFNQNTTGGANITQAILNLTTVWTKYSVTITLANTITAVVAGSALLIIFIPQFNLVQTLDITNVQLERGYVASPFKYETFETTLRRCLRYYQKSFGYAVAPVQNVGSYNGALHTQNTLAGAVTQNFSPLVYPVPLRASPASLTFYCPTAASAQAIDTVGGGQATSTALRYGTEKNSVVGFTGNAGSGAGAFYAVHWTVSAEL